MSQQDASDLQIGPMSFLVAYGRGGKRIDVVIAETLEISRAHAQSALAAGAVTCNGSTAKKNDKVSVEDVIAINYAPQAPRITLPTIEILYEDEDLLVVNKPAGIAVHAGAGVKVATLVDALENQGYTLAPMEDADRPGIVHRIDRDTSGTLAIALSERAKTCLLEQFGNHSTHREYWAMIQGVLEPASVTIDAPIKRHPKNRTTYTTGQPGRPSVTHVTMNDTYTIGLAGFNQGETRTFSQVSITLETGRTHQVRVHLRAVGHPLIGDIPYGADPILAKAMRIPRHALHAKRLAFNHPNGSRVDISAPLPDDLGNAIKRAKRIDMNGDSDDC